jgi:hypothetical protein
MSDIVKVLSGRDPEGKRVSSGEAGEKWAIYKKLHAGDKQAAETWQSLASSFYAQAKATGSPEPLSSSEAFKLQGFMPDPQWTMSKNKAEILEYQGFIKQAQEAYKSGAKRSGSQEEAAGALYPKMGL